MKLEKIEDIQNFDNNNFVHPWEYMKDVGKNKRMFAENAKGIYLYDEYGEKLIDPWETSDYDSRVITIYYQTRYESIEVYRSKAPTNYRFESLKWSHDGNSIVGIDSENNLLLFSKDKEFDPVIVQFEELNLELENFEEKRILNLLGWTN